MARIYRKPRFALTGETSRKSRELHESPRSRARQSYGLNCPHSFHSFDSWFSPCLSLIVDDNATAAQGFVELGNGFKKHRVPTGVGGGSNVFGPVVGEKNRISRYSGEFCRGSIEAGSGFH